MGSDTGMHGTQPFQAQAVYEHGGYVLEVDVLQPFQMVFARLQDIETESRRRVIGVGSDLRQRS